MLWYKAWLETRSRFLVALLGIVVFCSLMVFHGVTSAIPNQRDAYYYMVIHATHKTFVLMWVLAVTLLMMGGLLREKASGSSAYTLALPVSRARLMWVRIQLGLVEALALAIIPAIAIFATSSAFGKTHSVSQAAFHLVLLLGGGLLFFALAVLCASLIEGEYTAPVVSLGVVMALAIGLEALDWSAYSPASFMLGMGRVDQATKLLAGPVPWMQVASYLLIAVLLLGISVKLIQRREF